MLDSLKITPSVLSDLHERGFPAARVRQMSAERAFREWCEWHGFVGWADTLVETLDMLREAEKKPNE